MYLILLAENSLYHILGAISSTAANSKQAETPFLHVSEPIRPIYYGRHYSAWAKADAQKPAYKPEDSGIMESSARNQVMRLLGQASEDATVRINGKDVDDPVEVVRALSKIKKIGAHHSHATNKFQVEIITESSKLVLEVGRDSVRAYEYWVFYPHCQYAGEMHVGSVVTEAFDDYRFQ